MILLCISLLSNTALAEERCPEGMSERLFVDSGTRLCVPDGYPEADDSSYDSALKSDELEKEERIALISQKVREGGWGIQLGVGFGLNEKIVDTTAAFNIKARAGLQFASPYVVSFGLYLDFNLRPGSDPLFTMDATLDPTLHISFWRTRLSISLGFGAFLNKSQTDVFGEKKETKIYYDAFFAFKPAFLADWFLTQNAFCGFSLDFPVLLLHDNSANVWISLNAHIGYRF